MKTPPLLPEETLHRVLRVANADGLSVLLVAGCLTLLSAGIGDYRSTAIGLLVAAAGAIEIHGAGLLRGGEARGAKWLLTSQGYLMAIILGYCALKLSSYDLQFLAQLKRTSLAMLGADGIKEMMQNYGMSEPEFFRWFYRVTFETLALVTVVYQGGMAFYYLRRQKPLAAAADQLLEED